MTITAIQTAYAGCLFRSRLEARWAVFFDTLQIPWQYEPQGFELSHRLTLDPGTFRYLPDFWLPTLHLWAEVKGTLTDAEYARLLNAAAALGGCHDAGRYDLLVLGDLASAPQYRLHMHEGILDAVPFSWTKPQEKCVNDLAVELGNDADGVYLVKRFPDLLTGNHPYQRRCALVWHESRTAHALAAGMSARFEFGQHGAML